MGLNKNSQRFGVGDERRGPVLGARAHQFLQGKQRSKELAS
jgi:hypothetical protein